MFVYLARQVLQSRDLVNVISKLSDCDKSSIALDTTSCWRYIFTTSNNIRSSLWFKTQ